MGLGIYVHIPFCPRKCGYCSFNSITYDPASATVYMSALMAETVQRKPSGTPDTLYIGGGTPTVLEPAVLAQLISRISSSYGLANGGEVTVEANPGTLEGFDIDMLVDCGVNRVSLGAQSFDASELALLGRLHGPDDTRKSVGLLKLSGMKSINLDLIYGLPGQGMDSWRRSIECALSLEPDHMSLYCLSIDGGTPLHTAVQSGAVSPLSDSLQAEMYLCAAELLAAAGYSRYEISNFARPGHECRHNLNYWDAGDFIGLGAGAHSSVGLTRTVNLSDIGEYVSAVVSGGPAACSEELLSREDARKEYIMLSLRTGKGLSFDGYAARFESDFMELYAEVTARLTDAGCLSTGHGGLRLTERGIFASNAVISEFF